MIFCPDCGNMLYMSVRDGAGGGGGESDNVPTLAHVCKSCGFSAAQDAESCSRAVFTTNYRNDDVAYKQFMTPDIRHDPTLPHTDAITCANGDGCTRPPAEPRDVIVIKYDAVNLKYLYHCMHCGHFWKSGSS